MFLLKLVSCLFFLMSFFCTAKSETSLMHSVPSNSSLDDAYPDVVIRSYRPAHYALGLATYLVPPQSWQVSARGEENHWQFYPGISANFDHDHNGLDGWRIHFFLSEPHEVGDQSMVKTIVTFDAEWIHEWGDWGRSGLGIGFFNQLLFFKKSGEVSAGEGNASSTFYHSSKWVLVQNNTLNISYEISCDGMGQQGVRHWWLLGKSYIFQLWDQDRRTAGYFVSLFYRW